MAATTEQTVATVEINGLHVELLRGTGEDGRTYVRLRGADCILAEAEPGTYYPTVVLGE